MDDYPAAIADFLESTAAKVRGLTVDRVRNIATWVAVGLVLAMLLLLLLVFLFVGIFRLLGELVGVEYAYLILGGLFLVVGAFLWRKRVPKGPIGPDTTLQDITDHARSSNG